MCEKTGVSEARGTSDSSEVGIADDRSEAPQTDAREGDEDSLSGYGALRQRLLDF